MNINIPCPDCGCQTCQAENFKHEKYTINICRCNDGSGEFLVTLKPIDSLDYMEEKHQCSENDIANCLTARFNIDTSTIIHYCN